jgi:hypothetical protein
MSVDFLRTGVLSPVLILRLGGQEAYTLGQNVSLPLRETNPVGATPSPDSSTTMGL